METLLAVKANQPRSARSYTQYSIVPLRQHSNSPVLHHHHAPWVDGSGLAVL